MKYDALWRHARELSSDIARLEGASAPNDQAIDALHRDLRYKKDEMRKIELDIRDLDKVLS